MNPQEGEFSQTVELGLVDRGGLKSPLLLVGVRPQLCFSLHTLCF